MNSTFSLKHKFAFDGMHRLIENVGKKCALTRLMISIYTYIIQGCRYSSTCIPVCMDIYRDGQVR